MGQLRGKHGLDNAAPIISSVEFCLANQGPGSIAIFAREQTFGSRGCTQGILEQCNQRPSGSRIGSMT